MCIANAKTYKENSNVVEEKNTHKMTCCWRINIQKEHYAKNVILWLVLVDYTSWLCHL